MLVGQVLEKRVRRFRQGLKKGHLLRKLHFCGVKWRDQDMTFQKQLHDIIPLLENPLSLIESAKGGCLPPVLHIVSIALLMRPDSETLQNAYRILLKTAIRNKELSVVSVKEYSDLTMEYEQSRNPGKYREPRPPMCIWFWLNQKDDIL